MGLSRYKKLSEARQAMMDDLIARSVKPRLAISKHVSKRKAAFSSRIAYKPGIYKFKSFEDAQKSDLEMMIQNACRRKKQKPRCKKQVSKKGKRALKS